MDSTWKLLLVPSEVHGDVYASAKRALVRQRRHLIADPTCHPSLHAQGLYMHSAVAADTVDSKAKEQLERVFFRLRLRRSAAAPCRPPRLQQRRGVGL